MDRKFAINEEHISNERKKMSNLLDDLDHACLDLNDRDSDGLSSASVDETLERVQRVQLAEVVGQTGGGRLADHLKLKCVKYFKPEVRKTI
jgi:hypothetical protein